MIQIKNEADASVWRLPHFGVMGCLGVLSLDDLHAVLYDDAFVVVRNLHTGEVV